MSKYTSVCMAINLMETIQKAIGGGTGTKTPAMVRDLQDIAKDIRYGGKWEGDYEIVAESLSYCAECGTSCAICPYRKEKACKATLKKDAAAAIRQLAKDRRQAENAAGGEER